MLDWEKGSIYVNIYMHMAKKKGLKVKNQTAAMRQGPKK